MSYNEPESSGEDQTKSASFGEQANGRKEEELETLLVVQPWHDGETSERGAQPAEANTEFRGRG